MRLLPGSIVGRTTLALIAGLTLVLAVSAAVTSLTGFDGPHRGARLVERVETLTAVVGGVPAALRPTVLSTLDGRGLIVTWSAEAGSAGSGRRDRGTLHLERHLRHALQPLGVRSVVAGHMHGTPAAPGAWFDRGPMRVSVELADGTWLDFVGADWRVPERLIDLVLFVTIVGGGIAGLAVWVARRAIAPLGRFAAAAARFGADVEAPPLSESGPSEIRAAAQSFNRMQRRIRRFVEERTQMLAAVSHDLRTPITRLRLRAEFVEDGEQRAKMLKDLDEMEAMIAAVLAFAREETAAERRTTVDLAALLREIGSELVEAGGKVEVSAPPSLGYEGRPMALKRAFANLIGNAVVYGGRAMVRLTGAGDRLVVTIDDSGPGIPEAEQEKVFAPFYRLERSRSRDTGGTGLGLSVARTVFRGHGGDIALGNRPEGGLRQTVTLPKPA